MSGGAADPGRWIAGLVTLAGRKGVTITAAEVERRLAWQDGDATADWTMRLARTGRAMGLAIEPAADPATVPAMLLPALVATVDGDVALLERRGADDAVLAIGGIEKTVALARLAGPALLVEPLSARHRDARLDAWLRRPPRRWFRDIVLRDRRGYGEIVLASFVGNLLTFGTSLFAMQLWDRVVPAQSIPTLWVLALGVAMALMFELVLRTARVNVADRVGKRADQSISAMVFARALDLRGDARPRSTGAFTAQVRDVEQLRELLTSTTMAAFVDLPFVLLFLGFFALLAGPLILVLVAALLLILLPGLLLQWPLARLAQEGTRGGALRSALLVEAVERGEEIKALQAEPRFQALWEKSTLETAMVGLKQRAWTAMFVNWTQTVQQLSYTAVLVAGAYLVMAGSMTMGALIACSILTNRAVVLFMPMGQVLARWQGAKVAIAGLNDLIARPVDHDPERGAIRRTTLSGHYRFDDVRYAYAADGPTVLTIDRLEIRPGERVALLGRMGAGKSSLLRLMSGLALPTGGRLLLDDSEIGLIDPADLRRETAYLGQGAQLFLGTIRENLVMGSPAASDEAIIAALTVTGGLPLVQSQSHGLDLMLQEGGAGLSGGQRQTLLLARTLLRNPNILLLDEPSAPMDETSERQFVQRLRRWTGGRTLVVTTNRAGLLDLVDRIVVVDQGRIAMDGPKAAVIAKLSAPA